MILYFVAQEHDTDVQNRKTEVQLFNLHLWNKQRSTWFSDGIYEKGIVGQPPQQSFLNVA